tara:strand:- start:238 stop:360 length:123 start_codon:yes stop_codon:yes gene_type:complete
LSLVILDLLHYLPQIFPLDTIGVEAVLVMMVVTPMEWMVE